MNQTNRFVPPAAPKTGNAALDAYLAALNKALIQHLQNIYQDTAQGTSQLTAFTAAPTVQDLAEGQAAVRTDAGNEALYVNVNGTIRKVTLT